MSCVIHEKCDHLLYDSKEMFILYFLWFQKKCFFISCDSSRDVCCFHILNWLLH